MQGLNYMEPMARIELATYWLQMLYARLTTN